MFQYRQVLVCIRQGDTDSEIARARLMGRRRAAWLRLVAQDPRARSLAHLNEWFEKFRLNR